MDGAGAPRAHAVEKSQRDVAKAQEQLQPAPMKRRKPPRTREWKRRDKVSACTSTNFPWEVVFQILLVKSPRSLVILQMVDKNLRSLLAAERTIWIRIFKRYIYSTAYVNTKVFSSEHPLLNLHKSGLNGIPVHIGKIRTDPDGASLPPEFDASFAAYVRKAFALHSVDRCGLCGCRHRHDAYWSLGMRVCQLCMAENSISSWELVDKYGVHYSDIMRDISGKVFYFRLPASLKQHRVAFHSERSCQVMSKSNTLMFWRPHLEKILDLPGLYQEQKLKREAAKRLCAVLRRARVYHLRCEHSKHPLRSPDWLVMRIFSEERKRRCLPYIGRWKTYSTYLNPGDGSWAFWETPVCGKSRHHRRHGEFLGILASHIVNWEDIVV